MEGRCSHKLHNTRTRCHWVKLVGESFKTGKGKHFVRLLPQRVVEARSKGNLKKPKAECTDEHPWFWVLGKLGRIESRK